MFLERGSLRWGTAGEPFLFCMGYYEYQVKVLSVYDGDTLHLELDLGFHLFLFKKCRLKRCDAPELYTLEGLKVKQFVVDELAGAVETKVFSHAEDKFGRLLVEFMYRKPVDSQRWWNLSDVLLAAGQARRYSGGSRPWVKRSGA